jgi:ATP-dependent exoDNAse (exonuclease V) alpha subunit
MSQDEALAILKTGANVFLTGEPGSGKTHTTNAYVAYLRAHNIEPAITASTGIAATHIKGMTIHSWSGIGIKERLSNYDLDKIASTERVAKRIAHAHVLIIDEVSMLSASVFEMVEAVCRVVRRNSRPFGGLQVVLVGDFFQLPPVVKARAFGARDIETEEFTFEGQEKEKPLAPFAYT